MNDRKPTDRCRYLPFADPAHAPDWIATDRPDWLERKGDFPAFSDFCIRQLDELDRRTREWSEEEVSALPSMLSAIVGMDLKPLADFERTLTDIGMTWEKHDNRKRRVEAGKTGPGPTVPDAKARAMLPSALAAQDMAKLRYVIFPRFWPPRTNLARPWPETIAVERVNLFV